MKKLLTAFCALFITVTLIAQGIDFEHCSFEEALNKAKTENKLIFMDCYTVWCGPCKALAKHVFPQKEVGDVFNKQFICLKVDMEKGEGVELAKKYDIKAFPTLLFMDVRGTVIHKVIGGTDVAGLIEHAEVAKDPSKQINTLHKRYEDGERDMEFLSMYVKALRGAYERDKLAIVGQDFIANTPKDKLLNGDAWKIISFSNVLQYESEIYNYFLANKDKLIATKDIGQQGFEYVMGQCINVFLMKKAEVATSLEELQVEIDKVKSNFNLPQFAIMEGHYISTYYLSHKEYNQWLDYSLKRAEEAKKTDKRMAESMLIQTVYSISVDLQFADAGLYPKAISIAKDLIKEDADNLAGYYCLAYLYKITGDKVKALENVNMFISKSAEKDAPEDARVTKLKQEIEAM